MTSSLADGSYPSLPHSLSPSAEPGIHPCAGNVLTVPGEKETLGGRCPEFLLHGAEGHRWKPAVSCAHAAGMALAEFGCPHEGGTRCWPLPTLSARLPDPEGGLCWGLYTGGGAGALLGTPPAQQQSTYKLIAWRREGRCCLLLAAALHVAADTGRGGPRSAAGRQLRPRSRDRGARRATGKGLAGQP